MDNASLPYEEETIVPTEGTFGFTDTLILIGHLSLFLIQKWRNRISFLKPEQMDCYDCLLRMHHEDSSQNVPCAQRDLSYIQTIIMVHTLVDLPECGLAACF